MSVQQLRAKIVETARTQIGVRYHKDAYVPNVALDCVGFVAYALTGIDYYLPISDIKQGPILGFRDNRMVTFVESLGAVIRDDPYTAEPGDLLLWLYAGVPHHSGIFTEVKNGQGWCIHSSAAYNKVAEHPIHGEWVNRLYGIYDIGPVLERLPFLE